MPIETIAHVVSPAANESVHGRAVMRKLAQRLIPFLFVLYIVAYLDRINVGFAALEMNRDLGLGPEAFGLGAGLFFIGYVLFEVPSNLIMARVGARRWIARIMMSWGVVAMAMIAVRGARSFYFLRFVLGVAEAGFFPGIILYLTYWFPAREQAKAVALFMTAVALAGVIGGPLSGALLMMHGALGLAGWRWLFLLEGAPAVLLGIVVLLFLPDGPREARWLTADEREWLASELADDRSAREREGVSKFGGLFVNPAVWLLCLLYFAAVTGTYGITMWLPQIIKGFGHLSSFQVGILSAIPFAAAAIAMVLVGRSSDRRGERRWHLALSALVGAIGFVISAWARSPVVALAAISMGAMGTVALMGPFWAMPASFLSDAAAAGGIALINSVGNLGGFIGPYAVGLLSQTTHSFSAALIALAGALALAGVLGLMVRPPTVGVGAQIPGDSCGSESIRT
jgi:ACS family tartrate transporter-like MFS transporter